MAIGMCERWARGRHRTNSASTREYRTMRFGAVSEMVGEIRQWPLKWSGRHSRRSSISTTSTHRLRCEPLEERMLLTINGPDVYVPTLDINITGGHSDPTNIIDLGGIAIYSAYTPESGTELWRSDGTSAGTYLLA